MKAREYWKREKYVYPLCVTEETGSDFVLDAIVTMKL